MKFNIKNLGKMKSAELELGDLTIICGENNTGKTRTIHAIYGFLRFSHGSYSIMGRDLICSQEQIKQLLSESRVQIDITDFDTNMKSIINRSCNAHLGRLPSIFASSEQYFEDTSFSVSFDKEKIDFRKSFSFEELFLQISKKSGTTRVDIFIPPKELKKLADEGHEIDQRESYANFMVTSALYGKFLPMFLPNSFIVNTERTGIVTFAKELNFARNKLLRGMHEVENNDKLVNLFRGVYKNYPMPINENIDFIGQLEDIAKRESYIAKTHPEILKYFSEIVGGKYIVKDSGVYYRPAGSKNNLTMNDSSSSVRALLNLTFYLQHSAQKGDLLMIDEPELNLHPKNQRKMAKLLAMLVNAGIKVFITTHSDYIVHELNILILLNSWGKRLRKKDEDEKQEKKPFWLQKITKDKEYKESALLSHKRVKLYTAEYNDEIGGISLNREDIDSENGIDIVTFNDVIDEMSVIQERLLYGAG